MLLCGVSIFSNASDNSVNAQYTTSDGYVLIGAGNGRSFSWLSDTRKPYWVNNRADVGIYSKNGQTFVQMSVGLSEVRYVKFQRNKTKTFDNEDVNSYEWVCHYKDSETDKYIFFNYKLY